MRKRLLELLDELKKELGEDNDLDADTQKELEEVADALDDYLEQHEAAGEPGILEAMHKRLLQVEVEHPRIAAITGEALDVISKLGV